MTSIYRKKLINAVLFFAQKTKHPNMTKMMKLLNFFEFEHFQQTGYPPIGLVYYAFENGPVPKQFWLQVRDGILPDDLKEKVQIVRGTPSHGFEESLFVPKSHAQVDFSVFTPREKKLLEKLAFIYDTATASDMSVISHEDNMPWEKTKTAKGINAEIDYLLVLEQGSEIDLEEAKENLENHFAVLRAFNMDPVK